MSDSRIDDLPVWCSHNTPDHIIFMSDFFTCTYGLNTVCVKTLRSPFPLDYLTIYLYIYIEMPYAYMCECCANGCVHRCCILKHLLKDIYILLKNEEYEYACTNACPYVSYLSL